MRLGNIYVNEIWNYSFLFISTFVVMKITFELFIHLSNEESKTGFLFKSQEHCRYGKSFRSEIIYIRKKKKKYREINTHELQFQAENPLKGMKTNSWRSSLRNAIKNTPNKRFSILGRIKKIRKKRLLRCQHFN